MTMASTMQSANEILEDFSARFSSMPESSTYIEKKTEPESVWKPFKFPLFQIRVSGRIYSSLTPIGVQVTQDGSWYFAENEALNVIGTGRSLDDAVLDLEHHILHFWQYYRSLQDAEVTGDAIRLKRLFSGLLVEVACEAA